MTSLTFDDLPKPFVIAEVGGNHEGDFDYACRLARDAVGAGAHAVKFQAYRPELLVNKLQSPKRHKHFGRFSLTTDQYIDLAAMVTDLGAMFMASLWDHQFLEALDPFIEVHKIGSGDLTNLPLIMRHVQTNKPLCVSTAMSTMDEIEAVLEFVDTVDPRFRASKKLCMMHCVASYGNPLDRFANISVIDSMIDQLPDNIVVGYSDHTVGCVAIQSAVCQGAEVIEFHFTDDRTREFRDHHISKNKSEVADFMAFCRRRQTMWGCGSKQPVAQVETPERIAEFRRGIYFCRDVPAGTFADEENLRTLRPCVGIGAQDYYKVLGKRLVVAKKAFEELDWTDFETE